MIIFANRKGDFNMNTNMIRARHRAIEDVLEHIEMLCTRYIDDKDKNVQSYNEARESEDEWSINFYKNEIDEDSEKIEVLEAIYNLVYENTNKIVKR